MCVLLCSLTSFVDRDEAKLILDLETLLRISPRFDLGQFESGLQAKDNYGNGSVRRPQALLAAQNANLEVDAKPGLVTKTFWCVFPRAVCIAVQN